MKKFLSIILIIIYITISYPATAGISTQANTISKIDINGENEQTLINREVSDFDVEDNIIYPSRAITKNQLIVVYKPSSVGGGIKIFAYVGKINVKAPNDDKITPISDIMQIGEEGG